MYSGAYVIPLDIPDGDYCSCRTGVEFVRFRRWRREESVNLTAKDLAELPRTEAMVSDHGKSFTYEGVLLSAVLQKAGAPLGDELRGKALASYVLLTAKDGYQVVFALAELDPGLTNARVMLADKVDGKSLPETSGPFRIVAPDDKKMARSVRMLEKLEVVRLRP